MSSSSSFNHITIDAAPSKQVTDRGDKVFRSAVTIAGVAVLGLIAAITIFLIVKAWPAIDGQGWSFFTERQWFPDASPAQYGIASLAFGTVLSSFLALAMAIPVAIGSALFLVELAPRRLGEVAGWLVDLLAAVPSVVYGLWGVFFLVPALMPVEKAINSTLGFIPIFNNDSGTYGRSIFAAAVILAIMVLPIIAALARETFRQVPRAHKEAALALGATKWEVMRLAVLPYGRNSLIGASMLGLGRALGETIAIALILSAAFTINVHIFEPGGNTIAANIATKFGEAGINGRQALIASGLVLFAITLVVNVLARLVARQRVAGKTR